jgi:DHA1 family inner membrane transport protein
MGPTPLWLALMATTIFFVTTGSRMIPAMAIASITVQAKNRGSFMSIQSCLQQLSMGLASFLAGFIVYSDPATGNLKHYEIVGYIAVITGLFCLFLVRRIEIPEGQA